MPMKLMVGLAWTCATVLASGAQALPVRSMAAACAGCHGTQGVARPGMASLAGVPKDELLRVLMDFKSGRRPATLMNQLTRGYSDEQLAQLADYFAALK